MARKNTETKNVARNANTETAKKTAKKAAPKKPAVKKTSNARPIARLVGAPVAAKPSLEQAICNVLEQHSSWMACPDIMVIFRTDAALAAAFPGYGVWPHHSIRGACDKMVKNGALQRWEESRPDGHGVWVYFGLAGWSVSDDDAEHGQLVSAG